MGIDFTGFYAALNGISLCKNRNSMLTLGRQETHMNYDLANYIINSFVNCGNLFDDSINGFCENLFYKIGFNTVESLDVNNYQNSTYIHDLNLPINNDFKKYDFIIDAGTIEHIFNTAQVLDNIINLLEIDGIFVSITCNNNFSGHGFYQFSPDYFLSTFKPKYGMQVLGLFLAKVNSEPSSWINISNLDSEGTGRNTYRFNTNDEVYIICIAKKISNDKVSLLTHPPQQYSYENVDWKQ